MLALQQRVKVLFPHSHKGYVGKVVDQRGEYPHIEYKINYDVVIQNKITEEWVSEKDLMTFTEISHPGMRWNGVAWVPLERKP